MATAGPPALPAVQRPAHVWAEFSTKWQLLESPPQDGATNMALDAALLEMAATHGLASFRLYAWSRPTLSLGRHERARGRFDPDLLRSEGIDVVRRPTGGRALLHHHELTYAVAAPSANSTPQERRHAIRALLRDALAALGVNTAVADSPVRALRPGRGACFSEPSTGELVVGGAKLVASAQLDAERAFLQHGSILLADDQQRIAQVATERDFPPTRAASLSDALGRMVPYSELSSVLRATFTVTLAREGVTLPPLSESFEMDPQLVQQHRTRFLDPSWTWVR